MRKMFRETAGVVAARFQSDRTIVLSVGAATFFFGFFAGALLNYYFILVHSPFIQQFRSSLTYNSAIFGDGILLPMVNMIIAGFLLQQGKLVKRSREAALFVGLCITVYFHVAQAVNHIVNWAMPTPWHWNFLGLWHALYMFAVASFISLFYLVAIRIIKKEKRVPVQVVIVTLGIIIFFVLLRLDYIAVNLRSLLPQ